MTRAEMHEKRIAKWTELIRNAENSGLTIKKWCKDNGIQEKTFYYWKRQVRPKNIETPAPSAPCFAELDISIGTEFFSTGRHAGSDGIPRPEFLIQFRDCQIAVGRDFLEEDLRKIFRVACHV